MQVPVADHFSSFISILPSVLWFLFAVGMVVLFWRTLRDVLLAVANRVQAGAALQMGPLSIGPPPPSLGSQAAESATAEGRNGIGAPQDIEETLLRRRYPADITDELYLIHQSAVIRPYTGAETGLWRVRIFVEAYDDQSFLDDIKRVTYRLHDTFAKKVVATEAAAKSFELWLNIYGEFNVVAYVERKSKPPLWLTRYIDLPGRPTN